MVERRVIMIIHDTYEQKEQCSGCMACASGCPTDCINSIIDEEGFMYPKVEQISCIDCSHCEVMCPFAHPDEHKMEPIASYAAWSINESTRCCSATAGVFSTIAINFVESGGVVYGAAFDKDMNLSHIRVDTIKELVRLSGSKYLQSDFSGIYEKVRRDLDAGRKVMVSGTPCQIAGIRAAIKCDNLYLVDILCFGVPSPEVFKRYIEHVEKRHGKKVIDINFRDKRTGWKHYSQTIYFEDGSEVSCRNNDSSYMRGFLKKIYARPSCAKCPFCDTKRVGDITIGDFWGIEKNYPELDDERGVSLVYVSSQKGKELLHSSKNIEKKECPIEHTLQQALISPNEPNEKRTNFFNDFKSKDFDKLTKKYMKQRSKIVQFAINMLKY